MSDAVDRVRTRLAEELDAKMATGLSKASVVENIAREENAILLMQGDAQAWRNYIYNNGPMP